MSYCTANEAISYLASCGMDELTGSGKTTEEIDAVMYRASGVLDGLYGDYWLGLRADDTQDFYWPKSTNFLTYDGRIVPAGEIPIEIKRATALLGQAILHAKDITPVNNIKSETVKIGQISESTEYFSSIQQPEYIKWIELVLKPLIGNKSQTDNVYKQMRK